MVHPGMRFSVFQISRKGGREINEDRVGYAYTRDAGLFAVADGMGGHPEGEVASQLALQTLAVAFQKEPRRHQEDPLHFLYDGIMAGHKQLLQYALHKRMSDTPRSTLVACLIRGKEVYWAHCGDSRLYMVRDGRLIARTRDHSYSELQEAMHAHGQRNDRLEQVNRNVLFTCLGSPGRPVIDSSGPLQLQAGDRILLCSDGLWGNVDDADITSVLARMPISESVPELVEMALRTGGPKCDNTSVLVVEWEGAEEVVGVQEVSTESMDSEGFASTIQAHLLETQGTVDEVTLDEEEIERAIREINEAIRRSAHKRQAQ